MKHLFEQYTALTPISISDGYSTFLNQLDNQQKANDQQNAIELENQGNSLLAQGQYESAVTFYQTAQSIYRRLELTDLADNLNPKIEAARAGMAAAAAGAAVPETGQE